MWELTAGLTQMQHSGAAAWDVGVLSSTGSHPQRGVPPLAVVHGVAYLELKGEVFLPKSCFESELSIRVVTVLSIWTQSNSWSNTSQIFMERLLLLGCESMFEMGTAPLSCTVSKWVWGALSTPCELRAWGVSCRSPALQSGSIFSGNGLGWKPLFLFCK